MLTDAVIRQAKAKDRQYKITDGRGMYLLVTKAGKYFRMNYRFQGKQKTLALGVYPDVSLKTARNRLQAAREHLALGLDPAQQKKAKNISRSGANSFKTVGMEWFFKKADTWKPGHARTVKQRMEKNLFPWLGDIEIDQITAPVILPVLLRIEDRGAIETAHRCKTICSQIMRYAVATGRAERDPCSDLRGALASNQPKHMAAITDPEQVGGLLRAIDSYEGHLITRCALKLAPLVFVRPGDLRKMEWSAINWIKKQWVFIPEKRLKKQRDPRPLIVPLSNQALDVLREIYPLTGEGTFVFPSPRTDTRPLSNNGVLSALRRMGFTKDEMCGHGFRAMASTLLHELGWPHFVIELQLDHTIGNKVAQAYNHAEHLQERCKMMQAWADYLDALKERRSVSEFEVKVA